jgi:hypothetical protein
MARRADEWREHDLSGRFELGAPRDELTELAHTLDRMLDRIAQAILSERRLTDEVAHELRTPLTVIRSEAQLALLEPGPDDVTAASLEAIIAATDRMSSSIETMLSVARSAHAVEAACSTRDVLAEMRAHATVRDDVEVSADEGEEDLLLAAPLRVVAAAVVPVLDTPFSTPVTPSVCTSPASHGGCCCTSRTTGPAWRTSIGTGSSNRGTPPNPAGRVWDSPWSAASHTRWAARWTSATPRTAISCSPSPAPDRRQPGSATGPAALVSARTTVITAAHYFSKLDAALAFWLACILTRPLGASIGDAVAQPRELGGLGLGTGTSLIFLAVDRRDLVRLPAEQADGDQGHHHGEAEQDADRRESSAGPLAPHHHVQHPVVEVPQRQQPGHDLQPGR